MLKAYDANGVTLKNFCAFHRLPDGRRFFRIPDSPENRHLAETRGPAWAIVPEEDDKRAQVMVLLTQLGIPHRANMKLETLVQKLPVGARGPFL